MASRLEQGVLHRYTSTAYLPFWLIQKPDGSSCLTIDYRHLNQATPSYTTTIAKMPDLSKSFSPKAVWFTVLDIGNGFWALLLVRESQYRFAFTFQAVQFTGERLPQGYHNTPTIFHAQLEQVLSWFSQLSLVFQYVDDICLVTRMKEDDLERLDELLQLLKV